MSFALDVRRWRVKTERELLLVIRKVALEIFRRVVMRTPVDTGRARGNWQVEIGTPMGGVIDRFDPNGQRTLFDAESKIAQWQGDAAIFFFNNLPYILRLEYSRWSDQAPNGMVRLVLEEFPGIVEQEARS